MHRARIGFALALAAMAGLLVGGRAIMSVGAQGSPSMAGHPLVGTWLANDDAATPNNPPSLFTFSSDGIYTQVNADGSTADGTWKATGATTAELTVVALQADAKGAFAGTLTIRASITVSADGQSFTAPYTIEFTAPGGKASGQAGPGLATGTRINPEPMGTPVMTIPQLFPSAPATPAP